MNIIMITHNDSIQITDDTKMRQGSIPKVVFPRMNALLGVCKCAESITAERSSQAPSTVKTKTC